MTQSIVRLISALVLLAPLMVACGDDSSARDTGVSDTGGSDTSSDTATADTGTDDTGTDDTGADDTGAGDTGSVCEPACMAERTCCDGACVNTANDLRHCGGCNSPCPAPDMYCNGGTCEAVPCEASCAGSENCCGSMCCGAGQICCDPQGPIEFGPTCTDPDPETGTCPQGCAPLCMCNAPDTPIATPDGYASISSLRVGDLVYSIDGGAVVAVPIVELRTAVVPSSHQVMHVLFDDGTSVEISPTHPLADGGAIGDLRAGDSVEGIGVVSATLVPYEGDRTHDILPASDTGTYFVGDALIASTISP